MIERIGLALKGAADAVGPCVVGGLVLLVAVACVVAAVSSAVSVHGRD